MKIQLEERPSAVDENEHQPVLNYDRAEAGLTMEQGLIVATLTRPAIRWTVKVDPDTLWEDVAATDGQLGCLDMHGGPADPQNPMRINAQCTSGTRAVWLTTENTCWVVVPEPRIEPDVARELVDAALREEIRVCSIAKEYRGKAA
ncbi:MAG TPA: hypothetical protein VMA13_09005 [Candidatus Saccharimonadales bacterium]|nr:hypothetical protein [Candidatus Saccharimonadales bacterium]